MHKRKDYNFVDVKSKCINVSSCCSSLIPLGGRFHWIYYCCCNNFIYRWYQELSLLSYFFKILKLDKSSPGIYEEKQDRISEFFFVQLFVLFFVLIWAAIFLCRFEQIFVLFFLADLCYFCVDLRSYLCFFFCADFCVIFWANLYSYFVQFWTTYWCFFFVQIWAAICAFFF